MPRTTTARSDAIAAAADLFRRQGYAATGLETILAASGAPKGSFYHHFPGGKEDLATEAIRYSGDRVADRIRYAAAATSTPGELVTAVAAAQAAELRDSAYACGCPVATIALERAGQSEVVAQAADKAFRAWAAPLASRLRETERSEQDADRLARWAVANLEGALLLARAAHDATIITDAAALTAAVLDRPAELPNPTRAAADLV
ncbi:TetR/AcrR family transcriptional regulator [Microbacterium sp.]|uniref:TetR/AcrR family transcriptional regulator n=1 Tax=Microbacterium sp. TaxID=51671 RepID=UPI003C70C4E3